MKLFIITMRLANLLLLCGAMSLRLWARQAPQLETLPVYLNRGIYIPTIPGVPFSATLAVENVHLLPDGSKAKGTTLLHIARDSKGRTHNEDRPYDMEASGPPDRIIIIDPTIAKEIVLKPATMHATVSTLKPIAGNSNLTTNPVIPSEDLGLSTMEGLEVHGSGSSWDLPADADSKRSAIHIRNESWFSNELRVVMLQKHSNSRGESQLYRVTDLNRMEPDPAIFQMPANFQVDSDFTQIEPEIAEANLIQRVDPVYPPLAKTVGVHGTVEFTVMIGEDGSVMSTNLLKGHPLLVLAARDAVMQWKYQPVLLNGKAVSVSTKVVVEFTLAAH